MRRGAHVVILLLFSDATTRSTPVSTSIRLLKRPGGSAGMGESACKFRSREDQEWDLHADYQVLICQKKYSLWTHVRVREELEEHVMLRLRSCPRT